MTKKSLVCLLMACIAAPASANLKVGDKGPRIRANQWYNLPGSLKKIEDKHLDGQIIMVEFWATWCGPCKASIPHLIDLQKKYKNQGVILVALSSESDSDVQRFVTGNRVPYIVGSGAKAAASDYQIKSFPTAYLLDPNGNIAWVGHPATVDQPLQDLLKQKPPRSKGFLAEKSSGAALREARKLMKQRKYTEAMEVLERISEDFKGTKASKRSDAEIKKMKANSKIMTAIKKYKAEKATEGWLEVARMCAQYGDTRDAAKYYKRIMSKYPEAQASDLARQELKDLKIDPSTITDDEGDEGKAEASDDEDEGDEDDGDDEEDGDEDEDEDEEGDEDEDDDEE